MTNSLATWEINFFAAVTTLCTVQYTEACTTTPLLLESDHVHQLVPHGRPGFLSHQRNFTKQVTGHFHGDEQIARDASRCCCCCCCCCFACKQVQDGVRCVFAAPSGLAFFPLHFPLPLRLDVGSPLLDPVTAASLLSRSFGCSPNSAPSPGTAYAGSVFD